MPNRLQNQSYRPSPVVWGKHRSKRSLRLGSLEVGFSDPIFEEDISIFVGTNYPILGYTKEDQNVKTSKINVNRKQPSHPSPPPSHRNTMHNNSSSTLFLGPHLRATMGTMSSKMESISCFCKNRLSR
jgi:hypothetical protein